MDEGKGRPAGRTRSSSDVAEPIPLDPVNLLAGIAPGLELTADAVPGGLVPTAEDDETAAVTIEDVGRLLRMSEATIRRLVRTAVLRPVEVDGQIRIRRADVDRYLGVRTPERPGE